MKRRSERRFQLQNIQLITLVLIFFVPSCIDRAEANLRHTNIENRSENEREPNCESENCRLLQRERTDHTSSTNKELSDISKWEITEEIANYNENMVAVHHLGGELYPTTRKNITFPTLWTVSPSSDLDISAPCREHYDFLMRDLKNWKMWALMMYDATAKVPSGVLSGNTMQMGHFDECISIKTKMRNTESGLTKEGIRGRYCLASYDLEPTASDGAIKQAAYRAESYAGMRSNRRITMHAWCRPSTLYWGVCLPASCTNQDAQRILDQQVANLNETFGVRVHVSVDDTSCVDSQDYAPPMGILTYITIALLTIPIFLVLIGSCLDGSYPSTSRTSQEEHFGKMKRTILAFSLKRTMAEFRRPPEVNDGLLSLHGIKAIFGLIVYFGHKLMTIVTPPWINRLDIADESHRPWSLLFRVSVIYVDCFLFLSGLLFAFSLTREIMKRGKISWGTRIVQRYFRFTPPLLMLVLYNGYLSEYLGSGPLWKSVVGKNAELCRNTGWTNLLHVTNIVDFEDMCAPHTHQLSVDTQLAIVTPIMIYALYYYNAFGFLFVAGLCALSAVLRYYTVFEKNLSVIFETNAPTEILYRAGTYIHSQPIMRASPYIVGVLLGYYLRRYGDKFKNKLNGGLVFIGNIVFFAGFCWLYVYPLRTSFPKHVYDPHFSAIYSAWSPIVMSLSVGWLVTVCHLGYGGPLNRYFSNIYLVMFSRVTYALFLVQFIVFEHEIGVLRAPTYFTIAIALLGPMDVCSFIVCFYMIFFLDYPMKTVMDIWSKGNRAPVSGKHSQEENETSKKMN